MNNPRTLKVAILVLIVALFTSLGFLAHALWRNSMWEQQMFLWEQQVYGLAGYEGGTRALHDFRAGKLRLYVISGERDHEKYSGTNDGPFEVWYPQYFPEYYAFRYPVEVKVSFYNDKMRYMHDHSDKFLTITNTTRQ
jgi:hypothetical protein